MNAPNGPESETTTYNILFVCTGNTCRSPLGEAIARRMLEDRGWSHVKVRSAGAAAAPGSGASEHAIAVGWQRGIDLGAHTSQPLSRELVEWADLILGMGPAHLHAVVEFGAGEKAGLITDFLDGDRIGVPIEDPFGGDLAAYERTYAQLEEAIAALLDRLEPILSP
jgi:protein-tyrosine-phosphatase